MNQEQYDFEVMRELELRDYFAAQAMAALIKTDMDFGIFFRKQDIKMGIKEEDGFDVPRYDVHIDFRNIEYVCSRAYDFAERMMKERKNG